MTAYRNVLRRSMPPFDRKDKIRLIAGVRTRRLIWDMGDNNHGDLVALRAAWQAVGFECGKDPNDCKIAWRSLRQSYRYHCRAAYKRFKSINGDDDANDEDDPLVILDIKWQFAKHMSFLQQATKKNKNSESDQLEEDPISESIVEDTEFTETEYLEDTFNVQDDEEDDNDNADDAVENGYIEEVDDVNIEDAIDDVVYDDNIEEDIDNSGSEDEEDIANSAKNVFFVTKYANDEIENVPKRVVNNKCRTCTQTLDGKSHNLFDNDNSMLLQDITVLTGLCLKSDKVLSDFICGQCQESVKNAILFRKVCIEAQTDSLKIKTDSDTIEYGEPTSDPDQNIEEQLDFIDNSDNENYDEETLYMKPIPPPAKGQRELNKTYEFQCHHCGMIFTSHDLLKMHLHQSHGVQLHTRFVCKHCGHDFKYSTPLIEHLKSIGVRFAHKCQICGQKFHSRHFLKKHNRRVHGTVVEHICHICGKNFTTGFNLRNHIVRHAGTRPHKCKVCKAGFSTAAELNNHKRTHDNVRPYPCRYACGKSFRHCSNRSTHERVHMDSSLRPYQCEYCDKCFVTQGDCRSHQIFHTMSRDYSCEICDLSFKLQKHYAQHLTSKSHKKVEAQRKAT